MNYTSQSPDESMMSKNQSYSKLLTKMSENGDYEKLDEDEKYVENEYFFI